MSPKHQGIPHSRRTELRRRATLTLAGALCVSAAVSIWALVTGGFGDTDARILVSTLAVSLGTLTSLIGATVLERSDYRRALGQGTIALSVVAETLAMLLIWSLVESDLLGRSLVVSTALTVAGAHACLLLGGLPQHDHSAATTLSRLAVAFSTASALLLSALSALATGSIDTDLLRLLGVLVVIAVLNTLLVPISRRITRPSRPDAQEPATPGRPSDNARLHASSPRR